jgi:TolB-like protein/DNA-binding winged helix-turn-helix (wHTH) protein/Tfp pilus assembly protein PilF
MGPRETTPRVLRFGVFELDRRSGELRKEGLRVRLQEQPLRILEALLDAQGEPVTREALRQRLWPDDTFVDFDSGLNRAINRLRAALGDEADNPRFIETLERRAYRFIAPVSAPEPAAPPVPEVAAHPVPSPAAPGSPAPILRPRRAMWLGAALSAAALTAALIAFVPTLPRRAAANGVPIRSLAVLPLANLTGDPAQDYFSDGMTDALITNLASLPALRVISRQSVMRYKGSAKPVPEIGRELGVEGVVEGSVVRSGGRVRISVQLIQAPNDRHLWAHSYERPLEDVLALQGELARAIAEEVRLTLAANETRRLTPQGRVKPEAYDAYLLGTYQWNQYTERSLDGAIAHFRAAIASDPDFAPAHAGLALAYGRLLGFGYVPPGRGLAEQKRAALRALELDPGLGAARAALAGARMQEWDWEGAEAEYRRAVETDPGSAVAHLWYGGYLRTLGRFEEALAHRRRALELDPVDPATNRALARDLELTGQGDAALAQWNRILELEPGAAHDHIRVAMLHFEHGRADLGRSHLERARALGVDSPTSIAYLAIVVAESGNRDEAHRLLGRLKAESARRYVSPVLPAFVHATLGEVDSAFRLLENAYAAKDPALTAIQTCDGLVRVPKKQAATLRADPRFADLIRRMGFPRRDAARGPNGPASGAPEGRPLTDRLPALH